MTWLEDFENELRKVVPNGTEILFKENGFLGKQLYMRIKDGKFEIVEPNTRHIYEKFESSNSYWSHFMDSKDEIFICENLQEIVDAFKEKAYGIS